MTRLIELHRDDNEHTPVVVNADWIMWFESREGYTTIALGHGSISGNSGNVSSHGEYVNVCETYDELKELLNV